MRVVLWDLPEIMFKQKAEDRVVAPVAAPACIGVTGRCEFSLLAMPCGIAVSTGPGDPSRGQPHEA